MDIIQVKNLVKKYKKADKNSVDNISFNVKNSSNDYSFYDLWYSSYI